MNRDKGGEEQERLLPKGAWQFQLTHFALQARIDGFAFHGQNPESAFMNAAQWFLRDEAFEPFETKCEFADGK